MINDYISTLKKFMDFSGRARRKEFWMFYAITIVIFIIFGILSSVLGAALGTGIFGIIFGLIELAFCVPMIAVGVRRMHDVNKDWWYILIPIYSLILAIQEGDKGDNQYGPDPKA